MRKEEVQLGEVLILIAVEDQAAVVTAEAPTDQPTAGPLQRTLTPKSDLSYIHRRRLSSF